MAERIFEYASWFSSEAEARAAGGTKRLAGFRLRAENNIREKVRNHGGEESKLIFISDEINKAKEGPWWRVYRMKIKDWAAR